ncbi:DUF2975 domain-containing protein [Flavobacteriaceae sp. LMIT009]
MVRNIIFKTLIDILFIFQGFGILGAFIIIPFGVTKINQVDLDVYEWSLQSWILLALGVFAYILFMVGLYFLRKVGRYLLSEKYFSVSVIKNLNKSGSFLILSGVLGVLGFLIIYVIKLNSGTTAIYNSDISLPLFISIVGLFFIIQSEVLLSAKTFKEENDLTI